MLRISALLAGLAIFAAGCGGGGSATTKPAAEVNPPGDIPDNQAYVAYTPPGGGFSVKVPEGWARTAAGGAVTFTDKLNAIRMEAVPAASQPAVTSAKRVAVPRLARTVKGFTAGDVTTVDRHAGTAVRITYLADASADAVTARQGQDAVERYVFFHRGKDVILTLSGPKGADNVDPWRIVTDSLRWTR
jgi:hypothetical protein